MSDLHPCDIAGGDHHAVLASRELVREADVAAAIQFEIEVAGVRRIRRKEELDATILPDLALVLSRDRADITVIDLKKHVDGLRIILRLDQRAREMIRAIAHEVSQLDGGNITPGRLLPVGQIE